MITHTHIKFGVVSRAACSERATGGNALALAAYHMCARTMAADGRTFDFSRKSAEHVGDTVMHLPVGAPKWAADPAELWRRAQAAERRADSQEARWLLISIPREVRREDYSSFAAAISQVLVEQGMAIQADCHCPRATGDDGENPHVHLLATMRHLDRDGFSARKERAWNNLFLDDKGRTMRRRLTDAANAFLTARGYKARLEPDRRDDDVPAERDVSRAAVEVAKQRPDKAQIFPRIVAERQRRRRHREELAEARAETTAAARELQRAGTRYRAGLRARMRRDEMPSIGPADPRARNERRKRMIAAILRQTYNTSWLPPTVAENIARVELRPTEAIVVIHLRGGGRLIDSGDRIILQGRTTQETVREMVAAAERRGWTGRGEKGVRAGGTKDFRRALSVELLARYPDLKLIGLSEADRRAVEAELSRRTLSVQRERALAVLARAEQKAVARWERDQDVPSSAALMTVRDAQLAVTRGDLATITAAAGEDPSAACRAASAWRRSLSPPDPHVPTVPRAGEAIGARFDGQPMKTNASHSPKLIPPWARGPRRKKDDRA